MTSRIKRLLQRITDFRPVVHKQVTINVPAERALLKGRCALITGGTSGIGLSIAKAFAREGAFVIITGRTRERLDKALDQISESNACGFVMDNTDVKSFEPRLTEILESIKLKGENSIDILVNNAGVNGLRMPHETEEDFNHVIETNLKGTFFLSQLYGKYLVDNAIKGNILNIASASSLRPADSAYTLSKWGLRGLTLGLAKSLGQYGITVNGIAPGPTATPMMLNDNNNLNLDRIPLGRYILPEEIASMAVVLVSDVGRSIMGDLVYMTGGAGNLTYDDVNYSF